MEINPAYGKYNLSTTDNLYEIVKPSAQRPVIHVPQEKPQALLTNTELPKKSLKLRFLVCCVSLVALLALALAAAAMALTLIVFLDDSNQQQIKDLQSQLNISHQDIQNLQSQLNNSNQLIQSLELKLNNTRGTLNQTELLQSSINAMLMDEVGVLQSAIEIIEPGILNPAAGCREITQDNPSGEYWVQNGSSTSQVYCDTDRRKCGCNTTGGWMRVADLDMTDPNQDCPDGFRLVNRSTAPLRTCGRPGGGFRGCVSIVFPTHGLEYSHVCGRVIAYQFGRPEAFAPYIFDTRLTISDEYVEGVALTHGLSSRQHIWSFAAALDEVLSTGNTRFYCPCIDPNVAFMDLTEPPFVGQDYFCDTGSNMSAGTIFYDMDPLWDGSGCESSSVCCEFNNPPWFCKQLPEPTTDDLELRLCGDLDVGDEDTPLEQVEIYVN